MSDEEFAAFDGLEDDEPTGHEQQDYANGGQEQHADADMADDQHQQHDEQQQQFEADLQDHEQQEQQQQQHLHTTESAGLQGLDEEHPSNGAADADARRISAANSEAAEDNLLSGLADDNDDDFTDAPRATGTPTAAAAAAAAAGGDDGPTPDANKPVTEYELGILNLRAQGKPLNARQRRTLNRLLTRRQGQEAAAKLGLDVNALLEAQAEEQQQQQQQQQGQQQGQQQQPKAPQPPPSPKVNSTVLYISNLHWWTTDATVETAAAAYGPLVSCRFLEERVSGKSRGTACVEFADPEAAKRCKAELHGTQLDGRDVVVAWAAPGNFGMFSKQAGGRNFGQQHQQHFAGGGMGQMGPGMGQMGAGFAGRGPGFAAGAGFAGRGGRGGAAMMAGRGAGRGGRMGGGMGPGMGGGMGGGMGMGPAMGGEGGMGMNPMGAAAFAGNMANPMMQMMMMAQMAQSAAMGMGGRGMGGGYGGMGPGGGMMGGGAGGYMGGDEEQDFKRQRR